jgi:hypothetical protein
MLTPEREDNFSGIGLMKARDVVSESARCGVVNLWGVVRNEEEKNAVRVAAEVTPLCPGGERPSAHL